jgi:hypothetical protein
MPKTTVYKTVVTTDFYIIKVALCPIVLTTSVNVRHARALHATVPRPLYQDFMCDVRVLIRQVRIATQGHHQIAKTPMIALEAESG